MPGAANRCIQFGWRISLERIRSYGVPTRADLRRWQGHWSRGGELPTGVEIHPTEWGRDLEDWQARDLAGEVRPHCPGVVSDYADPYTTLCDYDSPEPVGYDRICWLAARLGLVVEWARWDRTERGWHLIIRWRNRMSNWQIVAMQCLLGSDLGREVFNAGRLVRGVGASRRWNLLFERKL